MCLCAPCPPCVAPARPCACACGAIPAVCWAAALRPLQQPRLLPPHAGPPQTLKVPKAVSDQEGVQVEVTRLLVASYFDIVRKNLQVGGDGSRAARRVARKQCCTCLRLARGLERGMCAGLLCELQRALRPGVGLRGSQVRAIVIRGSNRAETCGVPAAPDKCLAGRGASQLFAYAWLPAAALNLSIPCSCPCNPAVPIFPPPHLISSPPDQHHPCQ